METYTLFECGGESLSMHEAWIQLLCPDCEEVWEANPTDLQPPAEQFRCPYCDTERKTAEFMKATRDLEILETLHES